MKCTVTILFILFIGSLSRPGFSYDKCMKMVLQELITNEKRFGETFANQSDPRVLIGKGGKCAVSCVTNIFQAIRRAENMPILANPYEATDHLFATIPGLKEGKSTTNAVHSMLKEIIHTGMPKGRIYNIETKVINPGYAADELPDWKNINFVKNISRDDIATKSDEVVVLDIGFYDSKSNSIKGSHLVVSTELDGNKLRTLDSNAPNKTNDYMVEQTMLSGVRTYRLNVSEDNLFYPNVRQGMQLVVMGVSKISRGN